MMIRLLFAGLALLCLSCVTEAGIFSDKAAAGKTSPQAAMIMSLMPPECKKQVDDIVKQADEIYEWIVKKKCAECPDGVKADPLMLKEEIIKKCIDSYIDWLASKGMDVDTICQEKFRRGDIWSMYDKYKPICVMDPGEFKGHPNLCEAKEEDFPNTSACAKAEGEKVFKEKGTPPPMGCVSKALAKCNDKDLGSWKDHFLTEMKGDPKVHEGFNAWVIGNDFFKNGCTGKD